MKTCARCGHAQPESSFGKNRSTKDGVDYRCKRCRAADSVKFRYENPEKVAKTNKDWADKNRGWRKAYRKEWYEANKPYFQERYRAERAAHKQRTVAWQKANPSKVASIRVKARYGLTRSDFEAMLVAQSGLCLICGLQPHKMRRLVVDHCHATGKIRGLLCDGCNKGLGDFEDRIERLEAAIAYLKR